MLILTPREANQVRGLTVVGHALAPKPFVQAGASDPALNGMLGLPESVLDDHNHAIHWDNILALATVFPDDKIHGGQINPRDPTGPLIDCDWEQDPVLLAAHTYDESWPPGEIIVV